MTGSKPPDAADAAELELRIDARPAIVFSFFTDAQQLLRWLGISAQVEPWPGGLFRVRVSEEDIVRGEYLEVVPHERVVFTWGWEQGGAPVAPGASTVEVTFTAEGAGTLLRLRHSGLSGGLLNAHRAGWERQLPRLVFAVTGVARVSLPDAISAEPPVGPSDA